MFVNQEFSNHGSADPITARTTLQTSELASAFPTSQETRQALLEAGFAVRTRLLACRDIANSLSAAIDAAVARTPTNLIQPDRVVTIPGVPDLQAQAELFLYQAKLAVRDIGLIFKPLVGQHFDQKFKAFADWARATWGESDPLVQMLEADRSWVGRIIALRDAVEHPNHRRGALRILNFALVGSGAERTVRPPSWGQGEEQPTPIVPEMFAIVDNLLTLFEELLAGLLLKLEGASWLQVVEIPAPEREAAMPIRLRAVPSIMPPEA